MQIQIIWPQRQESIELDERYKRDCPLYFNPETGEFSEQQTQPGEQIIFWLHLQKLMLSADARDYVCVIDGQTLPLDATREVHGGMLLQSGQFLLELIGPESDELAVSLMSAEGEIPELELLLNHGGHFTPYGDEALQDIKQFSEGDPLKFLSHEYKHYLIWGAQQRLPHGMQRHGIHSQRLSHNFSQQEDLKDKTVTECVVHNAVMMERIFRELKLDSQDLLIQDEVQQIELLREIAPEHLKQIDRRRVSELLSRELYKLGLDSYL